MSSSRDLCDVMLRGKGEYGCWSARRWELVLDRLVDQRGRASSSGGQGGDGNALLAALRWGWGATSQGMFPAPGVGTTSATASSDLGPTATRR